MTDDDDHHGISQHDLLELNDLIRTTTSGLESLAIDTLEKVLAQGDEIAKVREGQRAMAQTLREIQFALHRLANPTKKKPAYPAHDGDLVGGYGD